MNPSDAEYVKVNFRGREYLWPKEDTKLQQVNDWVSDLKFVYVEMQEAGRQFRTAIQAGGACGIWPRALAEKFDLVYTFEPDPVNYWCLSANVADLPQKVAPRYGALGEQMGFARLELHKSEQHNVGAYYTVPCKDGVVPMYTIDYLAATNVDLLCLDIEGREVEALRGAHNTIETWRPFIMIEEKRLPQMADGTIPHAVGAATEWLEKIHRYKVVNRVHRDVILAPL